jgi:hypothetical protein
VETTSGLGSFLSSLAVQGLPMTTYNSTWPASRP